MCINELWLDPDKTSFQMNRNIVSHEHSNLLAIQGCAQTQTQTHDVSLPRPHHSSRSFPHQHAGCTSRTNRHSPNSPQPSKILLARNR